MTLQKELGLDLPFEDLRHEAVLSIVRTASMLANGGADIFRQHDLTEAQFNVLLALKYKDRTLTQSDLGQRLVITRASVTSVLDKLEAKKLVERRNVPGNRRIFHVELTPKGQDLVEKVEPVYRETVHRVLASFSDKDCRALTALLERVRAGAHKVFGTQ
ncbi:MAG: MarR family transcriptional regulator [FCB group bacterium]|jgi:MarR family 2-MHQ and catechol resistance regulon transcriptional repressor|nr:MarR family transcriptional regulator [FCB group bacterium]